MRHVVAFDGVSASSTTLPKNINFAIRPYSSNYRRWLTEVTFPFSKTNAPRSQGNPAYFFRGILYLQALVGEALAKYWVQKDGRDPNLIRLGAYLQRMAYPPYIDDNLIPLLQRNLPLFFVLSFILSVIIFTKNLVHEKERKLKFVPDGSPKCQMSISARESKSLKSCCTGVNKKVIKLDVGSGRDYRARNMLLEHLITGDETSLHLSTPETKRD
ncbi:ATP-binding cassette sub-family a member [Plakobranchus ocellatus]|uniref:ATP-binding cassette sub-family a member n=1 Tax=Plakobranchus ocellatus TaxID=259542 RepID=A0AAV4D5T4_9GAST|nr:ATP-binding cassette sub-family a member [Plakobranchus ocellatus]